MKVDNKRYLTELALFQKFGSPQVNANIGTGPDNEKSAPGSMVMSYPLIENI